MVLFPLLGISEDLVEAYGVELAQAFDAVASAAFMAGFVVGAAVVLLVAQVLACVRDRRRFYE